MADIFVPQIDSKLRHIVHIPDTVKQASGITVNGRKILSNIINTQIDIHKIYGGVVPEIASRNHVEAISDVTKKALEEANITFKDIDAIGVTQGAGLVGSLLVGLTTAKALAFSLELPIT